MLVQGQGEPAFKATFGDHDYPSYADAQKRYYSEGAFGGWQTQYISAYATMHPWEDFAESFAAYLAIVSVLDMALHTGVADSCDRTQADLPVMLDRYIRLGVLLNEMNRAMRLLDVVPEVFAPPIVVKMRFVHELVRGAAIPFIS